MTVDLISLIKTLARKADIPEWSFEPELIVGEFDSDYDNIYFTFNNYKLERDISKFKVDSKYLEYISETIDSFFTPYINLEQRQQIRDNFPMDGTPLSEVIDWVKGYSSKFNIPNENLFLDDIFSGLSEYGFEIFDQMDQYIQSEIGRHIDAPFGNRHTIDSYVNALKEWKNLSGGFSFICGHYPVSVAFNEELDDKNDVRYLDKICIDFLDWLSYKGLMDISPILDELENTICVYPMFEFLKIYQSKFEMSEKVSLNIR